MKVMSVRSLPGCPDFWCVKRMVSKTLESGIDSFRSQNNCESVRNHNLSSTILGKNFSSWDHTGISVGSSLKGSCRVRILMLRSSWVSMRENALCANSSVRIWNFSSNEFRERKSHSSFLIPGMCSILRGNCAKNRNQRLTRGLIGGGWSRKVLTALLSQNHRILCPATMRNCEASVRTPERISNSYVGYLALVGFHFQFQFPRGTKRKSFSG